ncbi:hypothetical protein DIPPA_35751 [Diplonema papillatum]|nr:hypothetical protein DIPPA_35751 [Diplonema papillatum]
MQCDGVRSARFGAAAGGVAGTRVLPQDLLNEQGEGRLVRPPSAPTARVYNRDSDVPLQRTEECQHQYVVTKAQKAYISSSGCDYDGVTKQDNFPPKN